jgi:predicted small secreted protein
MKTFRKAAPLTLLALAALASILLTACNTTKGAGQDIKAAGTGIQNSAERHGAN